MIELNNETNESRGICKVSELRKKGMILASVTDSRPVRFDHICPKNRPSKPRYDESEM